MGPHCDSVFWIGPQGPRNFDSEGFQLVSALRSCLPIGGSPGSISGIPVSTSIWDALQEDTDSPDIDQHPTQAAAIVNEGEQAEKPQKRAP